MAVQTPSSSFGFGGVFTKGSPLDRPADTAIRVRNFRLMPPASEGRRPYLRLRGGKTIRYTGSNGDEFFAFHEFRKSTIASPRYPICHRYTGGAHKWSAMDLASSPYVLGDILTISTSYGFSGNYAAARCNVRDKVYLANGLGVRNGTNSRPAVSSWDGTTVRYVGLDAYCVGGNPTVAVSGSPGYNNIDTSVSIYVGLHNTTTQHFSNAVFVGKLDTPTTDGEIVVSNLARLTAAYNNSTEQAELVYVFYATFDGGAVAYMILNSDLDGPLTAALGSGSKSLSVTDIHPQGFVVDNTQERPTENYPPRPMDFMAYANGRVYGVLNGGGSGDSGYLPDQPAPGASGNSYYRDFNYPVTNEKDAGSIVWSASADQTTGSDFVGVPEESFPYRNRKFAPNGEFPAMISETPGGRALLVLTKTGSFILSENADGLHVWTTLSDTDGCLSYKTFARTPRGPMWVTQNYQLVLLDKDSLTLRILSDDFGELLSGSGYFTLGYAADYLRSPGIYLDCYKVWRSDTSCVVYDFNLGAAYEETAFATSAAGTLTDSLGGVHHIQAGGTKLYTQEIDPYNFRVPTRDELSTGVYTEIEADYISQWMFKADRLERNRLTDIDVVGDSRTEVSFYADLVSDEKQMTLEKTPQCATDLNLKGRVRDQNPFYVKVRVQLTGDTSVLDAAFYPTSQSADGELSPADTANHWGHVYDVLVGLQSTGNRN